MRGTGGDVVLAHAALLSPRGQIIFFFPPSFSRGAGPFPPPSSAAGTGILRGRAGDRVVRARGGMWPCGLAPPPASVRSGRFGVLVGRGRATTLSSLLPGHWRRATFPTNTPSLPADAARCRAKVAPLQ